MIYHGSISDPGEHLSFNTAVAIGATTVNPLLSAKALSIKTTTIPLVPNILDDHVFRVSQELNFHAGCQGCSVQVNDILTFHVLVTYAGAGEGFPEDTACTLTVTRNK